jgi:hypothetical protein
MATFIVDHVVYGTAYPREIEAPDANTAALLAGNDIPVALATIAAKGGTTVKVQNVRANSTPKGH